MPLTVKLVGSNIVNLADYGRGLAVGTEVPVSLDGVDVGFFTLVEPSTKAVDGVSVESITGQGSARWVKSGTDTALLELKNAAKLLGRNDLLTTWRGLANEGETGWAAGVAGTGARTHVPGAQQLSTGATSGSFSRLNLANDGATFSKGFRSAADWYFSCRFSLVTTPTTGTVLGCGGGDSVSSANDIRVGADVAAHATNYCVRGPAGATLNTGSPFDLNKHTFRVWRTGGVTFSQVDGSGILQGTANINTDVGPLCQATNGTAANQAMDIEWYFSAVPPL